MSGRRDDPGGNKEGRKATTKTPLNRTAPGLCGGFFWCTPVPGSHIEPIDPGTRAGGFFIRYWCGGMLDADVRSLNEYQVASRLKGPRMVPVTG